MTPSRAPLALAAWALRVGVALFLIALSLWSLLLPVVLPMSALAAVNARVATVKAEIAGDVDQVAADVGSEVVAGARLARIVNPHPAAEADYLRLRTECAELRSTRDELVERIREEEAVLAAYEAQLASFKTVAEANFRHAREVAEARVERARATAAALDFRYQNLKTLAREVRAKDIEEARIAAESAAADLRLEQAALEQARGQQEGARAGVFLGPSGDYQSKVEKARQDLAALRIKLASIAPVYEVTAAALDEARKKADSEREGSARVERAGIIRWRGAGNGQRVTAGQELFKIAERDTVVVEAFFHHRYESHIARGAPVQLYLVAERRQIEGRVRLISGLDAKFAESYAVAQAPPSDQHIRVLIDVDAASRDALASQIGEPVKALVVGAEPDTFHRLLLWLFIKLEQP